MVYNWLVIRSTSFLSRLEPLCWFHMVATFSPTCAPPRFDLTSMDAWSSSRASSTSVMRVYTVQTSSLGQRRLDGLIEWCSGEFFSDPMHFDQRWRTKVVGKIKLRLHHYLWVIWMVRCKLVHKRPSKVCGEKKGCIWIKFFADALYCWQSARQWPSPSWSLIFPNVIHNLYLHLLTWFSTWFCFFLIRTVFVAGKMCRLLTHWTLL